MNQVADPLTVDLGRSGLVSADIEAHPANESHIASAGAYGLIQAALQIGGPVAYVIPYYDINGKRIPFYRLRLFHTRPKEAKYLQPQGSPTYIYFPKNFQENLRNTLDSKSPGKVNGFEGTVLLVEGEKKAARASKEGYLAVGIGGVYNWKTRTIQLPGKSKFEKSATGNSITVKLPVLDGVEEAAGEITDDEQFDTYGLLANGLRELIDTVQAHRLQVVICFDSDSPPKPDVQRAAAALAYELRAKGIPTDRIRQVVLPTDPGTKIGLDDFFQQPDGPKAFQALLHDSLAARSSFPRHPNIRAYINSRLQRLQLKRSQIRELALTIIADMDARGRRLKDLSTGDPLYFDSQSKRLMPVQLMVNNAPLHESAFGAFLYQNYDLSQADNRLIPWLGSSFTGESPIEEVLPRAISCVQGDTVNIQINDGQYIRVTGDPKKPWEILDNGANGLLFKGDMVEPLSVGAMENALSRLEPSHKVKCPNWWKLTLKGFKFIRHSDLDLMSFIFYMSPFLLRWRGTQLPVEMAVGEPGSGKSSMYALRQMVLSGRPMLKNLPNDLRDWYASITSVGGGIHVTDNVHFGTKELRQRISDELCRIVTEPDPYVELRRLFTTSDNYRVPIKCSFAVTAVQQPFINADILQRSIVFELGAVATDHDSDWVGHQIQGHGGRASWLAHHIWVLHQFLRKATDPNHWNDRYKSHHRLGNFEQILVTLGKVFQMSTDDIVGNLSQHVEAQVSDYDWTMEGLSAFATEWKVLNHNKPFTTADVATWCATNEDFMENTLLTSSRRLGRYIKAHKTMVAKIVHVYEYGTYANRTTYSFNKPE